MANVNLVYVFCGFIMGYAVFNIIDIIKQNIKMKVMNNMLKDMRKEAMPDVTKMDIEESNPLIAAYKSLTEVFHMPKEKVVLHNDDNSLTIAYGYACAVIIDKPESQIISIGVGIDKSTKRTEQEVQAEFEELKALLESCNFEGTNFTRSLANLVVKLQKVNKEKYADVTRQIHRDML